VAGLQLWRDYMFGGPTCVAGLHLLRAYMCGGPAAVAGLHVWRACSCLRRDGVDVKLLKRALGILARSFEGHPRQRMPVVI